MRGHKTFCVGRAIVYKNLFKDVESVQGISVNFHTILDDRHLKDHKIANTIGISEERIRHILLDALGMRKVCVRYRYRIC